MRLLKRWDLNHYSPRTRASVGEASPLSGSGLPVLEDGSRSPLSFSLKASDLFWTGALACMRASSVFSRSAGGATMLVIGSLADVYFQRVNRLLRQEHWRVCVRPRF